MDGYVSKPIHLEALWHELDGLMAAGATTLSGGLSAEPNEAPTLHLNDLPVANFKHLRSTIDNDITLFQELKSLYLSDSEKQRHILATALAAADTANIKHAAHALRGMVGVFFAERCQAAAQRVEDHAHMADCSQLAEQLYQTLDELRAALNAYVW